MQFTNETTSDGVVERDFTVGDIPGVLWTPESGASGGPLILIGHNSTFHKRAPGVVGRARHYVTTYGFSAAAIDAPGHGDRPRSDQDKRWDDARDRARAAGEPLGPVVADYYGSLAERAVPEWRATLDALQSLPEIGSEVGVGYEGMTLAAAIGIPLVAAEPRIGAAVIGGIFAWESLLAAARQITVPIQYLVAWDNPVLDRQCGFDLYDAFSSEQKTLHANPGGQHQIPRFEVDDAARFFARNLGAGAVGRT
ncbi:alpha/beta hydrolase [Rhodococcus sp. D2-41]|uniref:alpha/beta hydrolase n=1 Tax=Speluncibacter jeojiensis TaxID=2710754 RepID=UPI00240FB037|nr:alpha/beta hydrolase [Rhodococcus sp. D2-41]MDG3009873.1 alpha/beta hydrolase [Rhodococcus sp. D2-41]